MSPLENARLFVNRVKSGALAAALIGLLGCGWTFAHHSPAFFQAYLVAWIYWSAIALGCLALLMLHNLTGGEWGQVARPIFVAGARSIWLMGIMFIPIAAGLKHLYPWMDLDTMHASHHLEHKIVYLNRNFFIIRAAVYFALWSLLAWRIEAWLKKVEIEGQEGLRRGLQRRSAGGILLMFFTVSFSAVDWGMSLDPTWTSTIYGMWFVVAQGVGAFAFAIGILSIFSELEQFRDVVKPHNFHDLGTFLFAFIMLWAYFSFSQFLIIWSGNLEEEIPWYIVRNEALWKPFTLILVFGHFVAPFFILLSRTIKRQKRLLAPIALFILILRYLDFTWLLKPSMTVGGALHHAFTVADLFAMLAVGGIWIWCLFRNLPTTRAYLPKQTVSDDEFEQEVYGAVV